MFVSCWFDQLRVALWKRECIQKRRRFWMGSNTLCKLGWCCIIYPLTHLRSYSDPSDVVNDAEEMAENDMWNAKINRQWNLNFLPSFPSPISLLWEWVHYFVSGSSQQIQEIHCIFIFLSSNVNTCTSSQYPGWSKMWPCKISSSGIIFVNTWSRRNKKPGCELLDREG